MKRSRYILTLVALIVATLSALGQEVLIPLSSQHRSPASKHRDTVVLTLPFFDDFSNYEGTPDAKRWLTPHALVNRDYAPKAPTLGMVTLDALDECGNLYTQASTNLFGADTLASQPIRLDSLLSPTRRALTIGDSIMLSFFYLPGGWYGNMWERVGTAPGAEDSLFLEFYTSEDSSWHVVWCTEGRDADTAGASSRWPWRFVSVMVTDPMFLTRDFQFRFRNYASLDVNPKTGIAANCDQWNIDYVFMDRNRRSSDSLYRDIAFVEKAPSMLKNYQAMPARHYHPGDMAANVDMTIVNRYSQTLASNYSYDVFNENGTAIGHYDGGYENVPAFFPTGAYQTYAGHASPAVNFAYPAMTEPASFRVVHVVREGVGGDNHVCNDTVVFNQVFNNYYAYDDGFPENGYGLTSSSSKVWLAYRYDVAVADTLTALDIYFNRTRGAENEGIYFYLCVWNDNNGHPGSMLFRESEVAHPEFDGLNDFHRYVLSQPQVLSGRIYVGFEQTSNDFINIGFDRSNDSRENIFYRTGNEWQNSILSGSLMLRPVFGEAAAVGVETPDVVPDFTIYPNPASNVVSLHCDETFAVDATVEIYDMMGRRVLAEPSAHTISVATLPQGIYMVRLVKDGIVQTMVKKLVISK